MTTLQEAARKALEALEAPTPGAITGSAESWSIWYDKRFIAMDALRTVLAQQGEQQPVCHGCGIPAGDVHMSTCKSGKWPSRVSNGDTAAPAPQAQQELLQKERPDFMAGYDAGMADAKRIAQQEEPVAWAIYDKRGGSKSIHWAEQHTDGNAEMYNAVPLYTAAPAPQPAPKGEPVVWKVVTFSTVKRPRVF